MSSSFFTRIRKAFGLGRNNNRQSRIIYVGSHPTQTDVITDVVCDNKVISSTYTLWNFLPKNLFKQFRRIANFYFMCVGIIQLLIDTPVTPVTSILPLAFVIFVTAVKQGYEDWLRHQMDNVVNHKLATVVRKGKMNVIRSQEIKVGDIVKVIINDDFPCDLVMLSSSENSGTGYITTANLDGETSLKTRCCVLSSRFHRCERDFQSLLGVIECQQPNADLYKFVGNITITKDDNHTTKPLGPENILLRGARLRNTAYVFGCAIYTGQETTMAINSKFKQTKFSRVERSMNYFLMVFIIMLLVESSLCTGLKFWYISTSTGHWYIPSEHRPHTVMNIIEDFLSFMVLFNYIIPISLYVTVELQKFVGSMFFGWDEQLYDESTNQQAKANTSDLNEELGQVEYLFTDKTGTLTENNMRFRHCSINGIKYTEIANRLYVSKGLGDQPRPVETFTQMMDKFFMVLTLCHTVRVDSPSSQLDMAGIYSSSGEEYEYQASSPDEKALLEACRRYGMVYHCINNDCMEVTFRKEMRRFRLLHMLEFDPFRKRMTVIIQNEKDEIYVLCKGAESAILDRVVKGDKDETLKHVNEYAKLGLRTLVIALRQLSGEEFEEIDRELMEAKLSLEDREDKLAAVFDHVERDFEVLGATAVEDKLQDNVPETIEALKLAGIKVWVLTGDKEETAVNISHSARHFQRHMKQLNITNIQTVIECVEVLRQHCHSVEANRLQEHVLVIDGQSLAIALQDHESLLLTLCCQCVAVLCCRMSPIQKAEVVHMIKNLKGRPITAAIGDGANDVSMIQEANVGFGIMGKEGTQAVRCSDYAFAKFHFLLRVLLMHGHFYYVRCATLVQYFFYKNIAFILPQFYFMFISSCSQQSLYDSFFLMFFNISFTSLPILIYGIFEQHIKRNTLLCNPELYRMNALNKLLNWRYFILWSGLGLWHSLVTFFGVMMFICDNETVFPDGTEIGLWSSGTFVFTIIVLVVNIKLALQTYYWCVPMFLAFGVSILLFFLMTFFYNEFIWPSVFVDYQNMFGIFSKILSSASLWLYLLVLCVICLLPDITIRCLYDMFFLVNETTKSDDIVMRTMTYNKHSDYFIPESPPNTDTGNLIQLDADITDTTIT